MNNGITETAARIDRGEELTEEQRKLAVKALFILGQCLYEKIPDMPFICGSAGDDPNGGLPEFVFVCPSYGADPGATMRYKLADGQRSGPKRRIRRKRKTIE